MEEFKQTLRSELDTSGTGGGMWDVGGGMWDVELAIDAITTAAQKLVDERERNQRTRALKAIPHDLFPECGLLKQPKGPSCTCSSKRQWQAVYDALTDSPRKEAR